MLKSYIRNRYDHLIRILIVKMVLTLTYQLCYVLIVQKCTESTSHLFFFFEFSFYF